MFLNARTFTLTLLLIGSSNAFCQNIFTAVIKAKNTNEILRNASALVQGTPIGATADSAGLIVIKNIPDGKQIIEFSYVGYKTETDTFVFPLNNTATVEIFLNTFNEDLDEFTVSTTRSSRTIDDIPTRIEMISAGELDEKISMQPANAKMILTESTGIQTQQTSATSGNASIRIQGLDGKYTQLLKDGFPLYSGFSGGLSIMQIPPLDLKRVEVIKGASSTLYGGGAIAGLINFVTKVPVEKKELSFLINVNLSKASDISGYFSQKFKKIGVTFFASQNLQAAYDANHDGLSDIPKFERYNFNPRIFYYINNTAVLSIGINSSFENRLGGDMLVINNGADSTHVYFEKNITNRISSQIKFEKTFANKSVLTIKNSVGYFDRSIQQSNYLFAGIQLSGFTEATYLLEKNKSEWIFGSNLWIDNFTQNNSTTNPLDNNQMVGGVFIQNNYKVNEKLIVEAGLRTDATEQKNFFMLPRVSALYKFSAKFSTRIGGGLGYKTPTLFTEDAEEKAFRNIQPLNLNKVNPENSIGGNFDFNYRTLLFNKITFSINQMFFYTRLTNPIVLGDSMLANGNYEFENAAGYLDSKGFETNMKINYSLFALYCGYTFIDATKHYNTTIAANPLTAKNRIYLTLTCEIEEKLRIGYELFYTGKQQLNTGETKPDYWIMGISAEYKFKHFSLFINAENFTDTRQTRFENIYTGTLQNPQFKEIWAPTDGFLLNGGLKINVW